MCAVRLPRWSPDLAKRLRALDIDVFRAPESYGNEPVELTLELFAADQADARMRIRGAVAPVGVKLRPQDFGACGASPNAPAGRFEERAPLQD